MAKRGRTPSLVSGTHGSVRFDHSGRRHPCKRCKGSLEKGTRCVRVTRPGKLGNGHTYCLSCFEGILAQTQVDIDRLRATAKEGI